MVFPVLGGGWLLLGKPGGSGVLDYQKAADGTECLVTQSWNGSPGEPYTVGFYTRQPGQDWCWQYIDHEAYRWHTCRMEIQASRNEVIVFNEKGPQRTLELRPVDPDAGRPPYLPKGVKF